MRLQSDQPVHDMHACPFQRAGPLDVGLLVEPRLDPTSATTSCPRRRAVDERVDDRRVTRGAIVASA